MNLLHSFLIFLGIILVSANANGLSLRHQFLEVGDYDIDLEVPARLKVSYLGAMDDVAPRFISLGPDKALLIGSRGGRIYRVQYPYHVIETLVDFGSGFYHSATYRDKRIYVAETAGIWSAPYASDTATVQPGDFRRETVLPSLTGGHSSRTIITGPDNRLYVGLGISKNCSDEYLDNTYPFERRRGGVFVFENGSLSPYSSGLRNPIGLAFRPQNGKLYATNAGPDNLGYDLPPEIITQLQQNSFHGMPWFQYYNGAFRSGQCAASSPPRPVTDAKLPAALLPARSTPEGIVFLDKSVLGSSYNGSAVVAVHGSWATKPGQGAESKRPPRLALIEFSDPGMAQVLDLVTGFQRSDGSRFARPCGVAVGADGNIYFTSDDGDIKGLFRLTMSITPAATSLLLLSN